jgi:tetratricopeptide (TPR) repeat protein
MLDPYGILTKLLVTALLTRASRQPLILIFDTYEQVGKDVDDWLLQYLLREHHLQDKLIRLVITGRQRLSSRSDYRGGWQKLEQDHGCIFEVQIPRFNEEQTTKYLQQAGIYEPTDIQRIYSITKGWPYYLKEVAKQSGRLDFSRIEEDLSGFLLRSASPEQRELVKIASCCRGFNIEILNELWRALDKEPMSSELYDWIQDLSFVSKYAGVWQFDDVSRDIFRKKLFNDAPQQFELVNQLLADYFDRESNSYVAAPATWPEKYRNQDWLREKSSYLYHSLFVRQPNFGQFVTHLLEAHHFQCHELTSEVVQAIESEASLSQHSCLSHSCRDFLVKIKFVAVMGFLCLEDADWVNDEVTVSLAEVWKYTDRLEGLARFVSLYCQASHVSEVEAKGLLETAKQQAELIIINDSEFNSGLFLWKLANKFHTINSYEEAIDSYDRAISFKHDLHEAWYNRGNSLGNLGRYEEAIESYDRAISFQHDKHEAWYNRGNSLHNLGRYEEAIESYDRAISFKNDKHEAWSNRGISLDNLGRYEEAIESYDRAISFKHDKHEAWYNRGNSLDNLGRYEEAIESYDRAIEINPNNGSAWHNKGGSYLRLSKYAESISCYDQRLKIQPDRYNSWHDKGLAHFVTNDYLAAITSWQQAFNYISDPKVPRYYEDISGLIQEFIEALIPRCTQPPIQQTLLIPLLEIYKESNVITELGAALVNTLHLIVAPAISNHTANQWLSLWRTSSLGNEPAMELPLRLMSTAIEYKKDPSKRQRLWLNLPSEERPILDKALKLSD